MLVRSQPQTRNPTPYKEFVLADFSGGMNTKAPSVNLKDNEVRFAENVVFDETLGAIRKRKGFTSISGEEPMLTDKDIVSTLRFVIQGLEHYLYTDSDRNLWLFTTGVKTKLGITLQTPNIQGYQWVNTFLFTDGVKYYELGGYDNSTDYQFSQDPESLQHTLTLSQGDIIRNYNILMGTREHFYSLIPASMTVTQTDTDTVWQNVNNPDYPVPVDFLNANVWKDVTGIVGASSNVLREVKPTLTGHYEEMNFQITTGALYTDDTCFFAYDNGTPEMGAVPFTLQASDGTGSTYPVNFDLSATKPTSFNLNTLVGSAALGATLTLQPTDWANIRASMTTDPVNGMLIRSTSSSHIITVTNFTALTAVGTATLFYRPSSDENQRSVVAVRDAIVNAILTETGTHKLLDTYDLLKHTGTTATFTLRAKQKRMLKDCYIDFGSSGAEYTASMVQQGEMEQNKEYNLETEPNLNKIKRCTLFCLSTVTRRVFAAGDLANPLALYYSDIGDSTGDPRNFPINNVLMPTEGLGAIISLSDVDGKIVVGYENGFMFLNGDVETTGTWYPLSIPSAPINGQCICNTPHSFSYVAADGIYVVDVSVFSESYKEVIRDNIIMSITNEKIDLDFANQGYVGRLVFVDNCLYFLYEEDMRYQKILRYAWATKSFSVFTGYPVTSMLRANEDLIISANNYLLRYSNRGGLNDFSIFPSIEGTFKPVESSVITKQYNFGSVTAVKALRRMYFIFQRIDDPEIYQKVKETTKGYIYVSNDPIELDLSNVLPDDGTAFPQFGETVVAVVERSLTGQLFSSKLDINGLDTDLILVGLVYEVRPLNQQLPTQRKFINESIQTESLWNW